MFRLFRFSRLLSPLIGILLAVFVSPLFAEAKAEVISVGILSEIPSTERFHAMVSAFALDVVILPELSIRHGKLYQEVSSPLNFPPTQRKPKILFSLGRNRAAGIILIALAKDRQKKLRFFHDLAAALQGHHADGIAMLFQDTFDTFSFRERLTLASVAQELRSFLRIKGMLVTGILKGDLNLKNPATQTWTIGKKQSPAEQRLVPLFGTASLLQSPPRSAEKLNAVNVPPPVVMIPMYGGGGGGSSSSPLVATTPVPETSPSPAPSPGPAPFQPYVPQKRFATYIQNHGARRPQEWINALLIEPFTEVYVANYEPEWTGEFITLLKTQKSAILISVIAEGECALVIDPSCGDKNLTIYKDPNRVLTTTNIAATNAWLKKYGKTGEKVEGIHYDVEAYLGPGAFYQCDHAGIFGKCTIDDVIEMVTKAFVPLKTQSYRQSIVWGSSRNTTPDSGSTYAQDLTRLFQETAFQQAVDEMVILAYHDQFSDQDVKSTFDAAESACSTLPKCPQIIPTIETDHVPSEPVATFFEEGREAAESMLKKTQQAYSSLRSFAGQAVHWLLPYREPATVNRSVFPQNIENEGGVKITAVSASGFALNLSTSITFTVTYSQTSGSGTLQLQVMDAAKTRVVLDQSLPTIVGSNQTAIFTIAGSSLGNESAGTFEANVFLSSQKYFDRTRKKNSNITIFSFQPVISLPLTPKLSIPAIFGFSQPADVLTPSTAIKQQIISQVNKGVLEIPIYLGGNITPDGRDLKNGGQIPNLKSFMDLLTTIETEMKIAPKTLRLRGYLRASLTAADATSETFGPGKTSIMTPSVRQNIKTLIIELLTQNKYFIDSSRLDLLILDFEAILASNYDQNDLAAGDEGFVPQIADFVRELKILGLNKKIGVFSAGFINKNWFPSETAQPIGSPWTISPNNYISPEDAETLYLAGVDQIVVGAYDFFPDQAKVSVYADPLKYGPFHQNVEAMLRFQIDTVRAIGQRQPQLKLDPGKNLILAIAGFKTAQTPDVIDTGVGVTALQNMISQGFIDKILAEAFDFGSLDVAEITLLLNAQQ